MADWQTIKHGGDAVDEAWRHIDDGEPDRAVATLEGARPSFGDDARFLEALVAAYYLREDYERAKPPLERAAALAPQLPWPQVWLGRTLGRLGDGAGSASAFAKALALAPDDAEIIYSAAEHHYDADEYDKAEPLYRRLVAIAPESAALR